VARELVKKPGYMFRACVAWFIYNFIALGTLAVIVWLVGPNVLNQWYVLVPIIVIIVVTEYAAFMDTIGPVIRDWVKQEEYVETPYWVKQEEYVEKP
jgi:hypothetical protein